MQQVDMYNTVRQDLENKEEKFLAPYAIKSKNASRLYLDHYIPCPRRTEFERDKDRIIYSLAFKRLMEKTQVYMTHQGDHYTNRLSHTLEVTQISRSIATSLGLNAYLSEAIALGHDLGHTPFGHAVENVLKNNIENGFEHNIQSVLVVDYLENKNFNNIEAPCGLNLTNYTRYGILHHTKLPEDNSIYTMDNDNIAISTKYKSIEADLVCKIDTLAYLYHDLEDAIKNKNILQEMKLNDKKQFDNFIKELNFFTNEACKILNIKYNPIIDLWNDYNSNTILKAMIKDLIIGTQEQIKSLKIETVEDVKQHSISIAEYSIFKNIFVDYKKFMKKYIYTSPIACQMDTKAKYIANRLFESFCTNPEQLPYRTRNKYNEAKNGIILFNRKDAGYDITPTRVIANYIAGMTDRYAMENYQRMFE